MVANHAPLGPTKMVHGRAKDQLALTNIRYCYLQYITPANTKQWTASPVEETEEENVFGHPSKRVY